MRTELTPKFETICSLLTLSVYKCWPGEVLEGRRLDLCATRDQPSVDKSQMIKYLIYESKKYDVPMTESVGIFLGMETDTE